MVELFLNCCLNFRFFEEQLPPVEGWKDCVGTFARWNVDTFERLAGGLLSVHGDPPFAGKDDADASTVSEQMFGFRGSLYKFPPRIRNPQFGDFVCSFVRGELREEILQELSPAWQRHDGYSREQLRKRQEIADTWYMWTQELFCDAVGFTIGGPCFLTAFSLYLHTLSAYDYYRELKDLRYSKHPVTWLRVQFLADRARDAGLGKLADEVLIEWQTVANTMGIKPDYYGYYHPQLKGFIREILDDMLVEANPRKFTPVDVSGKAWDPSNDSLIRLLNWAWQVYRDNPEFYQDWEKRQIQKLLMTPQNLVPRST